MKLTLSTSNIMTSGQSVVRRPLFSKSNVELINGLRANFRNSQHHSSSTPNSSTSDVRRPAYTQWTSQDGDTIYVPAWRACPLSEERESYDITVKLFYLPGIPASRRCSHTKEAIDLVLKGLGVSSVDRLIVSFPGVSFDADDDDEDDVASPDENASADSNDTEGLDAQVKSWKVLESLYEQGVIRQLGVSEFSADRLEKFLPEVKIRPTVDQINVKDCCVVPKDLIMYAKENKIELLTHNDCTDILPAGTTRQILGPGEKHANILAARPDSGDDEPGLKGDIEPQWVVKYTAVVKDRGVVENKGYIASAQLGSCVEGPGRTLT